MYIRENSSLQNLNGFENLTFIGKDLTIEENDSLKNLSGLSPLTSIGGYINVKRNLSINSLNELGKLKSIGGFDLYDNPALNDISRLDTITLGNIKSLKGGPYNTWVHSTNDTLLMKGYLQSAEQNKVIQSNFSRTKFRSFDVNTIHTMKFREEGSIGKSAAIGLLAGLATGVFIARATTSSCKGLCFKEEIALFSGALGAIAGGISGIIVGSAKVKIPINGDQNTYTHHRAKILQFKIGDQLFSDSLNVMPIPKDKPVI